MPAASPSRITALDGLRGVLALVVMADHVLIVTARSVALHDAATAAVLVFFAMSARVLAPRWDNRFGVFLLKRAARLLPTYALGWVLGCWLAGRIDLPERVDPPAWSLDYEFLAMLLFPPILAMAAKPLRAAFCSLAAVALGVFVALPLLYAAPFIVGAASLRWRPRSAVLEAPVPQFLGHISYSLYLLHWPLIALGEHLAGVPGVLVASCLAVPVAYLACRLIEEPAIALSHAIGRRKTVPA